MAFSIPEIHHTDPSAPGILRNTGSMTAYLKENFGADQVFTTLQDNQIIPCPKDLTQDFHTCESNEICVRSVTMRVGRRIILYAETLIPKALFPIFLTLDNQPIGEILFANGTNPRQSMSIEQCAHKDPFIQRTIKATQTIVTHPLWCRRSQFSHRKHALLLYECFLPAFFTL